MDDVRYCVAKYVPDLFRYEPRNIGVIVADEGRVLARFLGQREDGRLDLRRAPEVERDGSVYAEWHEYWLREIARLNATRRFPSVFASLAVKELIASSSSKDMFFIHEGGEYIPEHDDMTLEDVAETLFSELVKVVDAPPDAVQESTGPYRKLHTAVRSALADRGLLARGREKEDPGSTLIKERALVNGRLKTPFRPEFLQRNGKLTIIEGIDFGAVGEEKVKDHALATAFMADDVRTANALVIPVELIVLAHLAPDRNQYAQEVGREAILTDPANRIVDWNDMWEREAFLRERMAAARLGNAL